MGEHPPLDRRSPYPFARVSQKVRRCEQSWGGQGDPQAGRLDCQRPFRGVRIHEGSGFVRLISGHETPARQLTLQSEFLEAA